MRGEAAPASKAELAKAKGVAVPHGRMAEVEGCKFIGETCEKGGRGRTERPKDEREDAEMSLRASCPASPERGNYVVWLDPTVTFATFPSTAEREVR